MKRVKIIFGWQNNKGIEDFILTPCLFLVYVRDPNLVVGIGIQWGFIAVFVAFAFGIPNNFPRFQKIKSS